MVTRSPSNELAIEELNIKKAALVFRAVNNRLRQKVLHLLHRNTRITVTSIYTKLKIEQSVASQHLAILRKHNIVKAQREGRTIYYSINYERLKEIEDVSTQLLKE